MAIKTGAVSVTTTPTLLTVNNTPGTISGLRDRSGNYTSQVVLTPSADLFVGGPDVTTSNGFPIKKDDVATFELYAGEKLYGIVASATSSVRVLQSGV